LQEQRFLVAVKYKKYASTADDAHTADSHAKKMPPLLTERGLC